MGAADLSQFEGKQCINLETYRKTGQPVATPVWFTIDGNRLFVVTKSDTGKVKRLRNNEAVRVMPCGMRGEPKGEWVGAKARFATPEETETALKQRSKKYGFKAKIAGFFSSGRGELVAISIAPEGA
ncbi:MAG TPA: PPOX class F420-dependent oxidoreductase [Nitrososphaera sp.]|nr:PPOX class F420-dependent oxidoreductase [uncultured Nitrososphaera sp.]